MAMYSTQVQRAAESEVDLTEVHPFQPFFGVTRHETESDEGGVDLDTPSTNSTSDTPWGFNADWPSVAPIADSSSGSSHGLEESPLTSLASSDVWNPARYWQGQPKDALSVASPKSHTSDDSVDFALNVDDKAAYAHLEKNLVVDGVTRRTVTNKTKLAALYGYDDKSVDNELVRSLSSVVRPSIPCQLETSDGSCFPPNTNVATRQYHFKLTFANLYLAPTVRLLCRFTSPSHPPYLTLTLDFHFNNHQHGEDSQISNYKHEDNIITFFAGRATCSGFNKIADCDTQLGDEEYEVIDTLRSFLEPDSRKEIKLNLFGQELSPSDFEHLNKVRARLPGGSGPLLPSIGQKEYAAFGGTGDNISVYNGSMRRPAKLMEAEAPLPMVPLPANTTFSSLREATAQLAWSATLADEESREALRLWSAVPHDARLRLDHKFPILALYFNNFDTIGGRVRDAGADVQLRLPHDMACDFIVKNATGPQNGLRLKGFLLGYNPDVDAQERRPPSALFRISSKSNRAELKDIFPEVDQRKFSVKCSPHYSSFTHGMQLEAVRELQAPKNNRWHPILLNQRHDLLEDKNAAEGISPALQARAEEWLRTWQQWNEEQMAIIDSITRAKGGMTIVMGPAATGKTLLQRAIAIYFYSLGYHVLALAPANDNVNKIAKDLTQLKKELSLTKLNFNRLFPGTRDISVDAMTAKQAVLRKVGHEDGDVLPFRELLSKLDEDASAQAAHREYGIVESVIRIADEKSLGLRKSFKEGGVYISRDVETWDVLRELIAEYREDRLNKTDNSKMELYRKAYQACKGQVVGLNRFMITTTGNVRASEMRDYWFSRQEEYGVPRKGVVILIDEAAKDVEVNLWSAIVSSRWAEFVKGVWLFGDDKQLQPTNTSSKGKVQFNYFSDRLDMALPNRLAMEGFPCHRLFEQRRMHEAISAYPNRIIYEGKLRDGPGMDVDLDKYMPGLQQVLLDIITSEMLPTLRNNYIKNVKDKDLRRHYIQVTGKKVEHERSLAVLEHIDVFMEKIFPKLFDFFKASEKEMREEVMIICAYNYARSEYDRRIRDFLAKRPNCTAADIPRIMSVDSSQGDEAYMVFFDASAQFGDAVGFMANPNRFNVAITRAKGVFWIIGGSMKCGGPGLRPAPNLITAYKRELEEEGQVHHFRPSQRRVTLVEGPKRIRKYGAGKL